MPEFVHFGAIFATRFYSGKDLRIGDSTATMKASWLSADGKFIAADPFFFDLSVKFVEGEKLVQGKEVMMDGGRYLCRLPIISDPQRLADSPDFGLFKQWGAACKLTPPTPYGVGFPGDGRRQRCRPSNWISLASSRH